MDFYFEAEERAEILEELTEEQRVYLLERLKRGKRTLFSNELVKSKGTYSGSEQELDREINDWEFIELLDGGLGNRPFRCECGMPLRYQYIVKNTETGEIKKFGKDHFEFHTGIPASVVKEIIKGFTQIDFELDEILYKVMNGWDQKVLKEAKAMGLDHAEEVQDLLDLDLPLLDRQINRVYRMILKEKEGRRKEIHQPAAVSTITRAAPKKLTVIPKVNSPLGDEIHQAIIRLIENTGTISVLEICEEISEYSHPFKGYYDSGKPKSFVYVAMVMDQLVAQGVCQLDSKTFEDRWYSVM
ncbi:DUF3895 domain-containing protein [Peribacillus frigoritolerans]|uniref:DUF3895 domain-containing protein n=1 Tax=Peribacillus frigoritolerans TaxID=450367 RepID=UPI001059A5BF|nr:DUF3895 domain-containing protein [Peribacillus frigoritolerans]TDL80443.1 DUF3895 domain-containing protein [Peribacillus frigoritolerans]